jgi:hypothetical protein
MGIFGFENITSGNPGGRSHFFEKTKYKQEKVTSFVHSLLKGPMAKNIGVFYKIKLQFMSQKVII